MSPETLCISCRRPKPTHPCGICDSPVCKSCEIFLPEGSFSFLKKVPADLTHTHYCHSCYDEKVDPELQSYTKTMEKAKEAFVFFTSQKSSIPLIRRSKELLQVTDCPDRDEAILRLAFQAALQDCNAVVEVEVISEKVRSLAYQTTSWRAKGYPAQVNEEKMARR